MAPLPIGSLVLRDHAPIIKGQVSHSRSKVKAPGRGIGRARLRARGTGARRGGPAQSKGRPAIDTAPKFSGKVSAQRKVRASQTETKGPAQKWPVSYTAPGRARGTGRASAAEAAPGPGDGMSQGGRRGYGPARAGLATVADMAPGPDDGTSLCGRLRARGTGRARAVNAATGPQERD